MKLLSVLVVLCLAYFNGVGCQVYIPVYNGTVPSQNGPHYYHNGLYSYNNTYNHNFTYYNNSRPSYNYNRPSYNYSRPGYNYNRPGYLGKGYNNRSNYNCSYAYGLDGPSNCMNNGTSSGNLWLGTIQIYDRLLFNREYNLVSHWWTSRDVKITYPENSVPQTYKTHERITAIRIYNRYHGKNQARAVIKAGGIGSEFVKIKLYSGGMGKGLNYLVQIFGH